MTNRLTAEENLSYEQILERIGPDDRQLKVIEECTRRYLRYINSPGVKRGGVYKGRTMADYLDKHAANNEEWGWLARAVVALATQQLALEKDAA